MFASLDRVDAVTSSPKGTPICVQTDHRDAPEIAAARELSTVFALVRVLDPLYQGRPKPEVIYYLRTTPPPFLVEAVAAAGGRVFVGDSPQTWIDVTESAGGARPRPVEQIADEAMSALARRTAAEAGVPLDRSGLERHELTLLPDADADIEVDLTDDDGNVIDVEEEEEDDGGEAKWTKIVKLASFAGAVLAQHTAGRWVVDRDGDRNFTLVYECTAGDKTFAVNLLGKALKFTEAGMEDSVNFLVSSVIAMAQAG